MREITNSKEDIPKFRLVKKFISDELDMYNYNFTIENIYETNNGELWVNVTASSFPKRPIKLVYYLKYDMSGKELYSIRMLENATFIPLNDDLGQLSFISRII